MYQVKEAHGANNLELLFFLFSKETLNVGLRYTCLEANDTQTTALKA